MDYPRQGQIVLAMREVIKQCDCARVCAVTGERLAGSAVSGRRGTNMDIKVLVLALVLCSGGPATSDPGLRKVPRIYNAYITANQNLEPSVAMPHAVPAVPVLQTYPLDVAASMGHPEQEGMGGQLIMPATKQGRYPQTFYPQSVGYQPYFQHPYYPQPYPFATSYQSTVYQGPGKQAGGYQVASNQRPAYQGPGNQDAGYQVGSNQVAGKQGPAYRGAAYQGSSYQGPGIQGLGIQEPGIKAPAYQGPAYQGPAYQGPAYQGPAYQGPVIQGTASPGAGVQASTAQLAPPAADAGEVEAHIGAGGGDADKQYDDDEYDEV